MESKGAPTAAKKESWRDWKMIQEKKKGASNSDSDTSERRSSQNRDCCNCERQELGKCCE